jgi:hypothetical protein
MRVLVCGGRDFNDIEYLDSVLNAYHEFYRFDCLIHGGAYGADNLAGYWAQDNEISVKIYPADWNTYGRFAGPIRNRQMLVEGKPNLVIAFLGGKGTENMIKQATDAGITVHRISAASDA